MSVVPIPSSAWAKESEEILGALAVTKGKGLSEAEVCSRLREFGPNRLSEMRRRSAWGLLADQLKSLIVALLAVAAVVAMAFGQNVEAGAILVVIVLNTAMGFFTELRAVRSMEALRRLGGEKAIVRRDGQLMEISADRLVPGDIVVLEAGDSLSADLRIVEASKLQADESVLTGESIPVSKKTEVIGVETPLAERVNMLYKGTFTTRGSGEAVVVGTGMDTELGRISALVEEAAGEELTPLEKRLDQLGRRLIWITLVITGLVALMGIIRGKEVLLMIETGVALAVAAIPEGLPIVATLALARGMLRMARRNVLVRSLAAVETLGATTVICTDKTGTLTENEMTVTRLALADGEVSLGSEGDKTGGADEDVAAELREALETGVLCGNASLSRQRRIGKGSGTGDPMELALLVAARKYRIEREELAARFPEVREVAFDPDVRMMATFHETRGGYRVAVKGAPEAVLDACNAVRRGGGIEPLDEVGRGKWLARNAGLAAKGLRILALAGKTVDDYKGTPYHDLTLFGLAAMEDPPRADVRSAIESCRNAGIRLVMVTGDQPVTAQKIAVDVGLIDAGDTEVILGVEVVGPDEADGEQFARLAKARVFARVSPRQKLDLIDIHRRNGDIVAMTGDGVNDAPALEKADIGVAMGRRGSEVAREAADMVLRDDALSSIVVAVKHGRIIFGNIRKFVVYLFSCNSSEVLVVALAAVANVPLPVLPLQILFLNLVTDVFPALALGVGPGDDAVMDRPPRDSSEPIMPRSSWWAVVGYAASISFAVLGALALALLWLGMQTGEAVTVSFLTLAFAQLWHVFNMRDAGAGCLFNDITRNPAVWAALALCVLLLILAVHLPLLSTVLQVEPIGLQGWILTITMSIIPLICGGLGHWVYRRARLKRGA